MRQRLFQATSIFFILMSVSALLPQPVHAGDAKSRADISNFYLRGDMGVGILDGLGSDEAFAVGAGLGYQFNDMLRSDITLDYAGEYGLNVPGTEASSFTSLINLYVDFALDGKIKPYLGAGVGFATLDSSNSSFDDTAFSWALHSGVSYELEEGVHLDFGYKYRAVEASGRDLDDHLFRFGIRFDLN